MSQPLDNPVWSSLTGEHAALGRRLPHAARYHAEVAPFVGIEVGARSAGDELADLVAPGESVLFVGSAPELSPVAWRVEPLESIAQMISELQCPQFEGPPITELTAAHAADVLDLTSRVYPHYFRPRTMAMGRYIGIYDGDKLAAMAGERMRLDRHVELSAICTDPAYTRPRLCATTGRTIGRRYSRHAANSVPAR